jgi:hypothetical protein
VLQVIGLTAGIGPRLGAGIFGLVLLVIFLGVPILAVISVIRNLRGFLRWSWGLVIVAATLFIPLIGLILSIGWFTFKGRFVDVQRP